MSGLSVMNGFVLSKNFAGTGVKLAVYLFLPVLQAALLLRGKKVLGDAAGRFPRLATVGLAILLSSLITVPPVQLPSAEVVAVRVATIAIEGVMAWNLLFFALKSFQIIVFFVTRVKQERRIGTWKLQQQKSEGKKRYDGWRRRRKGRWFWDKKKKKHDKRKTKKQRQLEKKDTKLKTTMAQKQLLGEKKTSWKFVIGEPEVTKKTWYEWITGKRAEPNLTRQEKRLKAETERRNEARITPHHCREGRVIHLGGRDHHMGKNKFRRIRRRYRGSRVLYLEDAIEMQVNKEAWNEWRHKVIDTAIRAAPVVNVLVVMSYLLFYSTLLSQPATGVLLSGGKTYAVWSMQFMAYVVYYRLTESAYAAYYKLVEFFASPVGIAEFSGKLKQRVGQVRVVKYAPRLHKKFAFIVLYLLAFCATVCSARPFPPVWRDYPEGYVTWVTLFLLFANSQKLTPFVQHTRHKDLPEKDYEAKNKNQTIAAQKNSIAFRCLEAVLPEECIGILAAANIGNYGSGLVTL